MMSFCEFVCEKGYTNTHILLTYFTLEYQAYWKGLSIICFRLQSKTRVRTNRTVVQILGQLLVIQDRLKFFTTCGHPIQEMVQAGEKKHISCRVMLTNRANGTICMKALAAKEHPEGITVLMVSLIGSSTLISSIFPCPFPILAA